MDSDTFINSTIYIHFRDNEYYNSWYSFIKSKDLGIICVDLLTDQYTIVDEKKWLLSKLKYGF